MRFILPLHPKTSLPGLCRDELASVLLLLGNLPFHPGEAQVPLPLTLNPPPGPRRDELARVLPLLADLPFIPAEAFRLQRCKELAEQLLSPLAERLEAVVLAGGRALVAAKQAARLRTLASFAGMLPARVGQPAFQRLNRLHNSVA